jgi:hypothetical protein
MIVVGSLDYLSVHNVQMIAAQRMNETETLSGTLSDMCALDHVYENTIAKAQFRVSPLSPEKSWISCFKSWTD